MPQHLIKKNRLGKVIYLALFAMLSFTVTHSAQAATLSLYPSVAKVSAGNIISVKVLVNTDGTAINTANGTIQFPTDLLEVMSVSKDSSIFSLWVQDPTFSNAYGTVSFEGGLPNPGFTGQGGQVMSIVFKAKKQGTASVIFSNDSAVLANDGLGTDVLTATTPGSIQVSSSAQLEVPAITTTSNSLPAKPVITSATNPSQDAWYPGTTVSFGWNIPSDTTSIQTLLSKSPTATPTVTYDSSVSQRTVNNVSDGVYYFSLRYVNSVGPGPIGRYKVQIDSTSPEKFTVNVQANGLQSILPLNATDAMSGIDAYTIKIDSQSPIRVAQAALIDSQYTLPVQNQGSHNLVVVAYDKAGNSTESDTSFTSPAIVPPTLSVTPTDPTCQTASAICSSEIKRNDTVSIKGQTQYPNTPVAIFVLPEGKDIKRYTTTTAADGSYTLLSDPLADVGSVDVWSQLVFSGAVQSPISQKITIHVNDGLIVQTSKSVIYGLSFIVPAVILLVGLLLTLYLGWHKFFGLKRRVRKEVQSTINDAHRALMIFKDELHRQLDILEKVQSDRDLTKKEEKVFKELQNNIDSIDEFIEKKLKKIK